MEFLGIGPLELFFILLIALLVLGPRDMVKAGRTIGKFIRQIVTSENFRTIQQASREIRTLPNRLMREAGIDEIEQDLSHTATQLNQELNKTVAGLGESIAPSINPSSETKTSHAETHNPDFSAWTTPSSIQSTPSSSTQPSDIPPVDPVQNED